MSDETDRDFRDLSDSGQALATKLGQSLCVALAVAADKGNDSADVAEFAFAVAVRFAELCEVDE